MWRYNPTPTYELYHHGILGQRWGKRNGPPYPLGSSDHSSSEKKAGWRKSLDKSSSKSDTESKSGQTEKKQGLTDGQKKAIKIGAAVAATALVTYGAYKLSQSGELDGLIEKGKSTFDSLGSQKAGSLDKSVLDEISSKTGLKQASVHLSPEIESILVGTERAKVLQTSNSLAWENNCTHASVSYILNRMGLDTKPEPVNFLNGHEGPEIGAEVEDIFDIFKNPQRGVSDASSAKELAKDIKSAFGNVDGSYGIISGLKNGTGHAFVWENVNGKIEIHNPQDEKLNSYMLSHLADYFDTYRLTRLDGCSLNDNYRNQGNPNLVYERIKSIVSNKAG